MTPLELITHIRAGTATGIMFDDALGADSLDDAVDAYNGSIDSAVRLCEALLPDWSWSVSNVGAYVSSPTENVAEQPDREFYADGRPSRALMIATLTAWEAKNGKA
jgi:hypothetical protein